MKRLILLSVFASISLEAWAQTTTPPWPDGCSVGLPGWAQQGLNAIFDGACDNHDRCWAECNGEAGPYHGLGHRSQCDQAFLADMTTACVQRAGQVLFPLGEIDNVAEFLSVCEGVSLAFFTAVSTPVATNIYWRSQCLKGCNPMACPFTGFPNIPFTCGHFPYTGPGFCYRETVTPDLCAFHVCPSFLDEPEEEMLFTEDSTFGEVVEKPTDEWQGSRYCDGPLDWVCCACQTCPNCYL